MEQPFIRALSPEEARAVYRRDIQRDFPPDEVKPWATIDGLLRRGRYRCLGLFAADGLRGYAFFASLPGTAGEKDYLLDYFAILPAFRGRGLGSLFLGMLPQEMKDAGRILGEAENPDAAETDADRETREKRLRFYRRCGVSDTGVTSRVWGVEYRLLYFGGTAPISPDAVRALYADFYHVFFPPKVYDQKVLIR